jgi:multiple antibiotic resistance protein
MFEFEVRQLVEQTLLVFAALFPILNPVGTAPFFLALTPGATSEERQRLARSVGWNALLLLLGSFLFGTYVIEFFGVSVPVVKLAGGILLCGMAWTTLRDPGAEGPDGGAPLSSAVLEARAFYPLTMPLTVGPGSISVAITLGVQHPYSLRSVAVHFAASLLGIMLLGVTVWLTYRYASRLIRLLGPTGTSVMLRLSAFILMCIGVQIAWNGLSALLGTVPTIRPN